MPYPFAYWVILFGLLSSADFFLINFSENKRCFSNTIKVSNSLNSDQVRRFVGPYLGPSCFQNLLPYDIGSQ